MLSIANRLSLCVMASTLTCAWAVPITFQLGPGLGISVEGSAPEITLDVTGANVANSSFNYFQNGDFFNFAGAVTFQGVKPAEISLLSFTGQFDKDPSINWAVTAVTASKSATFSFTFSQPTAFGIYSLVTSGLSGSMGDLRGDGVSVTNITSTSDVPTGNTLPALTMTGNCVAGASVPASNHPCPAVGQFGPVTTTLPPAYYPSMSTSLSFNLTPNDSATFQGQLLLEQAVPEPGTTALIALGLVGLVFGRFRTVRANKS